MDVQLFNEYEYIYFKIVTQLKLNNTFKCQTLSNLI